jgi:hypothetical protein
MNDGKKYLRRPDSGWSGKLELALLQLLQPFLDQAGLPYEVLDAPPESGGEGESQKRRRSS